MSNQAEIEYELGKLARKIEASRKLRFALFGGAACNGGGWHDFLGAFPTFNEAVSLGRERESRPDDTGDTIGPLEWWHVVDLWTLEIAAQNATQAAGSRGKT